MAKPKNGANRGDGRTVDGKFAPGNPGGPGRPAGYSAAFREVVTPEELGEVLRAILTKAKAGDLRAAELLLRRAVPELIEHIDPARVIDLPTNLDDLPDDELGRMMKAAMAAADDAEVA